MIRTVADFEDATAFERFALDDATPVLDVVAPSPNAMTYDLRARRLQQTLAVNMWEARVAEALSRLRPLLWGAAWKVLDVLLELALNTPGPAAEWRIEQKEAAARGFQGTCAPLSGDVDVWQRLCLSYAGTVQARHCIVHRTFAVAANGDLTHLVDRRGNAVPDLNVDQQLAFCGAAQRAASAVSVAVLSPRARADLLFHLDRLAPVHGLPQLGVPVRHSVVVLITDAVQEGGRWVVDVDALRGEAGTTAPYSYHDVEVHFPGTGTRPLRGELEAASAGRHLIDRGAPPAWLA